MIMNALVEDALSLMIIVTSLVIVVWGLVAHNKFKKMDVKCPERQHCYLTIDALYIMIGLAWFILYAWRLTASVEDKIILWTGTYLFRPMLLLTLTAIATDRIYKANGTIIHWIKRKLHRE